MINVCHMGGPIAMATYTTSYTTAVQSYKLVVKKERSFNRPAEPFSTSGAGGASRRALRDP